MKRGSLLAVGVVLGVAVAGCSDSGGGNPKGAPPGGSSAAGTPTAAAFPGDVPAGVRGEPVWSAQLSGRGAVARPVGSSVALITPHGDGSTVEFRDAATGAGRATVEVTGEPVATTWHGRPALVAESVKKTPSDGISPEKTAWQIDAFDEQGRRIAHKEVPGRDKPLVVDGRQIVQENGKGNSPGALVISDAGGDAPGWRIPCKDYSCIDEGATVAAGIVVHRRGGAASTDPETLTGFDAATGTVLWSPQALARPAGATAAADPELVDQDSGKLVVAWHEGEWGTPRPHTVTYTVNEPATGRLLTTGPTLATSHKSGLASTDGTVLVVATMATTAAWETGTGKLLWQQAEDEKRLDPAAVVGPVLYSEDPSVAVDLRTKAVLRRAVPDVPLPVGPGHAVVVASGNVYVFAVTQS